MNLPRSATLRRPIALQSLVVGFLGGVAAALPVATTALLDGGNWIHWWLPQVGSVGQTVMVYLYAARLLAFLVVPVGAVAVGVLATRRLELVSAHRSFVASVLAGAATGFLLGYLALFVAVADPHVNLLVVAGVLTASRALMFTLAAFAGAAYAEIRRASRAAGAGNETT